MKTKKRPMDYSIIRNLVAELFKPVRNSIAEMLLYNRASARSVIYFTVLWVSLSIIVSCKHENMRITGKQVIDIHLDSLDRQLLQPRSNTFFFVLSEEGKVIDTIWEDENKRTGVSEFEPYGYLREETYAHLCDSICGILGSPWTNGNIYGIIKGDFNGDGLAEVCWMEREITPNDSVCCDYTGFILIRFTARGLPDIRIDESINPCGLTLVGDLNFDGHSELGFSTFPYPGAAGCFLVYSLKNKKWKVLAAVDDTENMRISDIKYIEVDPKRPGFCIKRVPLIFYDDPGNRIPLEFSFDSTNGYLLNTKFSHVVELSVRYQ